MKALRVTVAAFVAVLGLACASTSASAARDATCDTTIESTRSEDVPTDVADFAHGTPVFGEGSLWLVINRPGPEFVPGFDVETDQWMLRKVVWYPRDMGAIEIVEQRVGSSRRVTMELTGDSYVNGFTFRPTHLVFPRGGCWRVTATLGVSKVRFHVRVPTGREAICHDLARQVRDARETLDNEGYARSLEAAALERACDEPSK